MGRIVRGPNGLMSEKYGSWVAFRHKNVHPVPAAIYWRSGGAL
jgi:hypothetical protein